uniref:Uncharacterized protein n=1 Tax=Kalanchoe fedtschenkoi TaxID=63787 RepID=A0A7N1A328_KALFE
MSEIQSQKRPRDELEDGIELPGCPIEDPKKQKTFYNDILSILDQDEDEPAEDLSELLTSLEQELSGGGGESTSAASGEDEDGTVESVMRRLLEASDDELGIPSTAEVTAEAECVEVADGGDLGLCDGLLWELEDEAANYYTLLQSELFL